MQHGFPPQVLLWTSLCSCLHLPISEYSGSPAAKYPAVTTGQYLLQVFKFPSRLVPQSWCMNVYAKIGKTACPSSVLCFMKKMTPDLCEDATSATRLVSVMLFLSADLSPEGLAWASGQRTGTRDNQDGSLSQNHHRCHGDLIIMILTTGWDSVCVPLGGWGGQVSVYVQQNVLQKRKIGPKRKQMSWGSLTAQRPRVLRKKKRSYTEALKLWCQKHI